MSFDERLRPLTSTAELRALAHPLRLAILEALGVHGEPMTATEIAEVVDESPSNCSWHLRKLAEHGFVEETPGHGRKRPWQITTIGSTWDGDPASETGVAAAELGRILIDREVARFWSNRSREDEHAAMSGGYSQHAAWLTPSEWAEIQSKVFDLMEGYRHRLADLSARPDDAQLVWSLILSSVDPLAAKHNSSADPSAESESEEP